MRELIEEPEFTDQLRVLGDLARIDDALAGVSWALSSNPEVYDRAWGEIRLLKTEPFGGLPPLNVFFSIGDDAVHLLYVEPTENDDAL